MERFAHQVVEWTISLKPILRYVAGMAVELQQPANFPEQWVSYNGEQGTRISDLYPLHGGRSYHPAELDARV